MKTNCSMIIVAAAIATATNVSARGLLSKLKDRAKQEVSKIENTSTQNEKPKNKLSANVTRTVVITLSADETFDYSENCIDLGSSLNQVSFIVNKRTSNGTQCFSYKTGSRTLVACPN